MSFFLNTKLMIDHKLLMQAILDFFKKFTDSVGSDLQFVIDDISKEDSSAVGVTWHLEWRGRPFPFSKGCSFYRLEVVNGQRKILFTLSYIKIYEILPMSQHVTVQNPKVMMTPTLTHPEVN
ncbi:hypothetical protein HAX54_028763 [Datura stramonium]|uniref:Uncharacterized protein n=1 Tax=Datura stramonium TaxID=4076 RepID=A0ABS8S9U9_DATST|nr:hypothetical protein [Datura stramonium]